MIGYVTVGSNDMAKAREYYDALLGSSDEGPPGDEGGRAFCGAYFRDPEGNKFCAFRIGPAAT